MLRLSRLARASVHVRFTAPGHANPYFLDRAHLLDPAHPAAKLPLRSLPSFVCPQFTIRAFPNAILQEPADFVPVNPLLATGLVRARTTTKGRRRWWSDIVVDDVQQAGKRATWSTFHDRRQWDMIKHVKVVAARQIADARVAALAKNGRRNIGLLFHTSKKATSKSCVIRRRLRSKMTAAIGLVVTRSADAIDAPESDKTRPVTLVSRPQETDHLFLQDWTYLVIPNLAIYKTPLPNLVQVVRKALLTLTHHSKRLESSWSALPKRRAPPVDRQPSSQRRVPKDLSKPQSVIRTRTNHPHRSHPVPPASKHTSSHSPRESTKHDENVSTRLYSSQPIMLSRENHK